MPRSIRLQISRHSRVIGLFDSGLGGLTVLARVRERMPSADIVFFADQANVPYGDRTHADLLELLQANLARLDRAASMRS